RDSFYQGSVAEGFYEGVHAGWSWGYGPLFHVLTLPMLAFENLATGWKWFLFITVLAYLLAVILLFQVLRPRVDRWQEILPFAFVTLNFYPVFNSLTLRTIEIFEFLFIAVAMWWSSREHRTPVTEAATGLALAAGALTKFIPGVLIFGLFAGRRWTALRWSIGGTAAGLAVAHLTLGLGNNAMFAGLVPSEDSTYFGECQVVDNCTYSSHLHNQALSGFLLRTAASIGLGDLSARTLQVSIILGAAVVVQWLVRHRSADWALQWAVLLTAAVVLVPKNEYYYLCLLVMPLAYAARRPARVAPWIHWLLLGVAYTGIGVPIPIGLLGRLLGLGSGIGITNALLEWSVPFLCTSILLVVLMWTVSRDGDQRQEQSPVLGLNR
ncbi:uncharacterized protein METZ01_LOCUS290821, partial [marine metagenome]